MRLLGVCCNFEKCNHNSKLMPSVSAQDPASKHAPTAEGILPLWMKHGNFVISGTMWHKFNANRPWLTFAEFWLLKERAYKRHNA